MSKKIFSMLLPFEIVCTCCVFEKQLFFCRLNFPDSLFAASNDVIRFFCANTSWRFDMGHLLQVSFLFWRRSKLGSSRLFNKRFSMHWCQQKMHKRSWKLFVTAISINRFMLNIIQKRVVVKFLIDIRSADFPPPFTSNRSFLCNIFSYLKCSAKHVATHKMSFFIRAASAESKRGMICHALSPRAVIMNWFLCPEKRFQIWVKKIALKSNSGFTQ